MGPGLAQVSLSTLLATPRPARLRSAPGEVHAPCECGDSVSPPLAVLSPSSSHQRRQLLSTFAAVFPAECTPRNSATAHSVLKRASSPLRRASCSSKPRFLDAATPSPLRPVPLCRPERLEAQRLALLTPPRSPLSAPAAETGAPDSRAAEVAAALEATPHVSGTETPRGHKEGSSCLSPLLASPAAPKIKRRRLVLAETQSGAASSARLDDASSGGGTPLRSPSPATAVVGLHAGLFLHLHQWRSLPGAPLRERPALSPARQASEGRRGDRDAREARLTSSAAASLAGARSSGGAWRRWGRMQAGRLEREETLEDRGELDGGGWETLGDEATAKRGEPSCLGRRRVRDDASDAGRRTAETKETPRRRLGAGSEGRARVAKEEPGAPAPAQVERTETKLGAEGIKVTLLLSVPRWYSLANTICSYGFFCMHPNRWTLEPSSVANSRSFSTPSPASPGLLSPLGDAGAPDPTDALKPRVSQPSALSTERRITRSFAKHDPSLGASTALADGPSDPATSGDSADVPGDDTRPGAQRGRRRGETPLAASRRVQGSAPTAGSRAVRLDGSFSRPLRFGPEMAKCCEVSLSMQAVGKLRLDISAGAPFSRAEEEEIVHQVKRMCRLRVEDWEHVQAFWKKHEAAAARGFGLLFRSPTLWEDIVKTVTLCNVRWRQSCVMNDLFCRRISSIPGSFPSPLDFLRFNAEDLSRLAGVGYRADRLLRLAHRVVDGSLDLAVLDQGPPGPVSDACPLLGLSPSRPSPSAAPEPAVASSLAGASSPLGAAALNGAGLATGARRRKPNKNLPERQERQEALSGEQAERLRRKEATQRTLLGIHGIGPFAAENILQLVGFTEVDAFDSETVRHMGEVHGVNSKNVKEVLEKARERFARYSPYQFIAYWHELWEYYERKVGDRSDVWTTQNSVFLLQDNRHLQPPAVTADGTIPAYVLLPENAPAHLLKRIREGGLSFMAEPPTKRSTPAASGAETPDELQTRPRRRGAVGRATKTETAKQAPGNTLNGARGRRGRQESQVADSPRGRLAKRSDAWKTEPGRSGRSRSAGPATSRPQTR
ncbi:conserved hypothetical protein [Neospora caninum Liverpool]|uniref:Uncharacterized protein n=1 Tax=Neospora caninum (strain Liverpool) TaxID=572307 RepID=F0VJB1_NEOCL|nr:conserved hypothetical protein [Neospora caninum Liverpool]CBZ53822.1 conserved hypothetical protein [Neospora caninum Liverpool]CEL67816.1 TPA: hypothetical protein BN1204_036030 [Neospora caninum Liverpool]|eukprot:XP_003883854.1 conserved hypothetical protein [Neospora caninum Liverpool]